MCVFAVVFWVSFFCFVNMFVGFKNKTTEFKLDKGLEKVPRKKIWLVNPNTSSISLILHVGRSK